MVAAIAFACIQSNGVSVRRVQFTAEFKACLPFLRFSGLGHEPIDTVPFEAAGAACDLEQHLHIAHTATASISLPPLAFLRYVTDGPGADPTIYLRAFGICLLDRGVPRHLPVGRFGREDVGAVKRPLDRLADVVDHVVRYGEHRVADGHSPFRFVESRDDPLGERAALEGVADLRIVAQRKVRAVLLAEPPSFGRECRLRLYIDTDRPRPSVPVVKDHQAGAHRTRPAPPEPAHLHLLDNDRET